MTSFVFVVENPSSTHRFSGGSKSLESSPFQKLARCSVLRPSFKTLELVEWFLLVCHGCFGCFDDPCFTSLRALCWFLRFQRGSNFPSKNLRLGCLFEAFKCIKSGKKHSLDVAG